MPSIQITTDPDPATGGDPMEERTDVDYDYDDDGGADDGNNEGQASSSPVPENFPSPSSSSRPESSSSPPLPPPPSPPPNNPTDPQPTLRLAEVDRTINFEVDPQNSVRVSGRLYIKNVTVPGRPLIFKIKTTAQKFHVWPAIGLVAPDEDGGGGGGGGGLSSPKVTVKPGVSLASIVDERFKVQVMIVPIAMLTRLQNIEDEDQRGNADPEGRGRRSSLVGEPGHSRSTFEELSRMWEYIWRAEAPHEDHRVSVILTDHSTNRRVSTSDNNEPDDMTPSAPPPLPPLPSPPPGQRLNDWSSWTGRVDGLESKLDEIDEFISEQLSFVQLLLYILMGMVCSSSIILFIWGGGTVTMTTTTASSVGSALNYLKNTAVIASSPNSELHQQQQQQQQPPGLTLSSLVASLASVFTTVAASHPNPPSTNTKFNTPPSSNIVVQDDNIFAGASTASPPPPPPPLLSHLQQQQQPFYSFETTRFEYSSNNNNIPPRPPRRPPLCPMFG